MPAVQNYARETIVNELKQKLQVDLGIEKLHFQPFTSVELVNVYLNDKQNDKILTAEQIYANVDIIELFSKNIAVNSLKINDFEIHLNKENKKSPLNIQFIIDAFKSDDKKEKQSFDLKLAAITLGNGTFKYDIKDQKEIKNKFDPNHILVTDFNTRLVLKSLKADSVNIQIKKLSLAEKSGLNIEGLTTRIISDAKKLHVKGFKLDLPNSLIQLSKCEFDFSQVDSLPELINKTSFNCGISSSYITLKDISAFVPELKNFDDRLFLKTSVHGSISDLTVENFTLDYEDEIKISANAELKDINTPETYVLGSVNQFFLTTKGLQLLLDNFASLKSGIPKEVINLGNISFVGDVSGYLKELVAFGSLKTDIGTINTDLLFGFKPKPGIDSYFTGKVIASDLDIKKLLDKNDFDKLSFDLNIDLQKPTNKKMMGEIEGQIDKFDFKNHTYQNITLNGSYDGMKIEGLAEIDDQYGYLAVNGLFDLSEKIPVLDFTATVHDLQLDKLHLSDKYPNSHLSLNVSANFAGNNIDNAEGYLSIDSISFAKGDKSIFLDQLYVEASGYAENRKLRIQSDIINGEVLGAYSFTTMLESVKQSANIYLPALVPANSNNKCKENNLSLDFTIGNTSELSEILNLPVTVLSPMKITGFYNNIYEKFKFDILFPSFKAGGTHIQAGHFVAENSGDVIKSNITGLVPGKNGALNEIELNLSAKDNIVESELTFKSNTERQYKGTVLASTKFSRLKDKAPLHTEISLLPSELTLNDSLWRIDKSRVVIDSGYVAVSKFKLHNNLDNQSIDINGIYSPSDPNKALAVDLQNINLEYIFNMLAIDALNFGGYATGSLHASSIKGSPYANVNLNVADFKFNNALLGDLSLFGELEKETNKVLMTGEIKSPEDNLTSINGFISPITKELSLNFDAKEINIAFINKYINSLFNNVSGKGTGNVHLFGDFSDVTIEGDAYIENGTLGINFLNTTYSFTDTIHMKKDRIYFDDVLFSDTRGNQAAISGYVTHNYFSDFVYKVSLAGKNFLLYNATEALNPTFYGTVYGSGTGTISGDEQALNIDVKMITNENTKVRMNFMDEVVNQYSFITYKAPKDENENGEKTDDEKAYVNPLKAIKMNSGMDINMNFYIDATPDATVELIMDPVGGDILRGTGSGAMHFVWGSTASPQLFGTYTIEKGSYNFTFQKILERKFSIQQGSSVQFRGDPFAATLNIEAVYKLTANLNDLDQYIAERSGQANVPVQCLLNLSGELRHPNVNLDVSLPNADGEVQRQVKNLMNTEDMINRQVVYLLLLSKFYTPSNATAEHRTSDFASVASATLSTQLSKVLSQIDDRWQVGTNIRTSDADFSSTEVELILSSNLLNDRLILNGNFGYRDDPNTQDAFIGDVDIEYLLTPSGNWRIKAYNHYNEKYYYTKTAIQTQGVGIMYRKDFDKISEFFGITPKPKTEKKDSTTIIYPDSTKKGSSLSNFVKIKK